VNKFEQGHSDNRRNERTESAASGDKKPFKKKSFNKEARQNDGPKRDQKKSSWGSDSHTGERRRKAPEKNKGGRNKTDKPKDKGFQTKAESRADRKVRNQEAHAKQHSRKKPRTPQGKPGERNTASSDGPKAPQRYGKRPYGKKSNHRKGENNNPRAGR